MYTGKQAREREKGRTTPASTSVPEVAFVLHVRISTVNSTTCIVSVLCVCDWLSHVCMGLSERTCMKCLTLWLFVLSIQYFQAYCIFVVNLSQNLYVENMSIVYNIYIKYIFAGKPNKTVNFMCMHVAMLNSL